ncbi:unnamed protein product [Aphanomyces euteiches]|uniref:Protein LTV1 homolog n=1 Tax=Aphanomyces euteiches TaxID=100861 RepID=A0A6G0X329_9STRA|nr:hypothetical protein Ae201684_009075 [Aphanomyces euteiches]KAH9073905.1 hypothetical protein Ae201684P_003404 [Aphanomyces euteiches]KAH9141981.1 hypothetical protein AeRB84_013901 [Aphanomyces euteiches]
MGKKKSFINKKEAQHFHVVHRSQRDPKINDPEASKYVLLSASKPVEFGADDEEDYDSDDSDLPDLVPQSKPAAPKGGQVRFGNVVARDMVNELGMVNDGYDYSKHMKEIGRGQFYSAGGAYDEGAKLLSKRVVLPDEVLASTTEHERMLEAITLSEDVMDEDLKEALVNDGAFEELNDDFMAQAAQELPEDDDAADGFDYDAHIAKLMAAAEGIPKYRGDLSDDEDDDDEEYDDEEDDEDEEEEDKDEAQRALDEAFEKLMAEEYDDDQVGELEEEETRGKLVLEGDLLDQIVDDFVNIRQELMADEGRLGNPLREGNRLKEIIAECAADLEDEMKPDDPVPAFEPADMSGLESNPYLVARVEDEWDCETIVSTYSNLDNHPTLIREPSRAQKKKKKAAQIAGSSTIVLSSKTGMPLNIHPLSAPIQEEDEESDDEQLRNPAPQLSRGKGETKEEKKLRKALAKNHKKERRQEKKEVKLMYKDEKQRLVQVSGPSVSVFRY